jgi:AcrR family transcriptional regulator
MVGWNSGAWAGKANIPAVERRAYLREQYFAAGLELFARDGYELTSIERLCAATGTGPREFYREFADREELLIALHDRITTEAMQALLNALAAVGHERLEKRIEAGVRAYLGTYAADPRRARVAYVEVAGVGAAVERHRLAWRDRFVRTFQQSVQRAVSRGEAADRDYRLTAIAVIGTLNELAYQWARHPTPDALEDIARELTRLIYAALTQ